MEIVYHGSDGCSCNFSFLASPLSVTFWVCNSRYASKKTELSWLGATPAAFPSSGTGATVDSSSLIKFCCASCRRISLSARAGLPRPARTACIHRESPAERPRAALFIIIFDKANRKKVNSKVCVQINCTFLSTSASNSSATEVAKHPSLPCIVLPKA